MLDIIRSQQIYAQSRAIAASRRQPLATYQSRDAETGDRYLAVADGGIVRAKHLSDSIPDPQPLVVQAGLGIPGFMQSR
jgi:hypothetical protein